MRAALFAIRTDQVSDQNGSPFSDLYVTVQVWAGSKPLTVPVQTSYKAFKNERRLGATRWSLAVNLANLRTIPQLERMA